jgi:hypothetical protein
MSHPVRKSTLGVYESKWRHWLSWSAEREINQVTPSIPQVADFLMYLSVDKKLATSTIEGYRSILQGTFKHTGGPDLLENRPIQVLRKDISSRPANLDLGFVLMALTQPPYEPLRKASIADLTLITLFLILLASGRRRSDFLAIDITRTQTHPGNQEILLFPNVGFLPQNDCCCGIIRENRRPHPTSCTLPWPHS